MSRLYIACVFACWLAAMSWLVSTKIMPALQQGTPPDYRAEFIAEEEKAPPPVAWEMFWNDRPMGTTVSQAYLQDGEPSEVRSLVEFKQLEMRAIASELMGGFSYFGNSLWGDDRLRVDLTIATRLRLDWEGELHGFQTSLKSQDSQDLLFVRGERSEEDRLKLSIYPGGGGDEPAAPIIHEVNMPTSARFSEAFSPRSKLEGLSVGQKWTTPVVSPLSTTRSIRLVESLVEKRESITWQDEDVETFVVVYRYDAGSGASARDPVGHAWVRDDGIIVRQELPIGNARIRFERTADPKAIELANRLNDSEFDRSLHRTLKSPDEGQGAP